jgi:WD40 repeat protein
MEANATEIRTLKGHTGAVRAACLSQDGKLAVSGSKDKTLILWNVETGEAVRTFKGHKDAVHAVCFAPDGKFFISGSRDRTMMLWDVTKEEPVRTFERHKDAIHSISLSSDGNLLLSGSGDGHDYAVGHGDGAKPSAPLAATGLGMGSELQPCSKTALSGSWARKSNPVGCRNRPARPQFRGHSADCHVVRFSSDDKRRSAAPATTS